MLERRRLSNCGEVARCSAGLKAGAGAPPPAAAAALTPPAHRSVGFPSARSRTERGERTRSVQCVTARIPFLPSCDHGVEDNDQLAHAGDDGNLRLFSLGNQALIVGLQDGVVERGCANAGHVDGVADPAAAPLDVALAAALSTVV